MTNYLEAKNIGKTYNGRRVVRDVSFKLGSGEIIGILGPNGAGKTTSFYILTGLIQPEYGQIFLNDVDITNVPMYRRARLGIGYLPQEPSIFRGLSVQDNILCVLEVVEKDQNKRMQRLEELLAEFSITHLRNTPSIALSGGERRRLEVARCLAMNPKFLLLDEPLAGIDPISINEIKDIIFHLKEKGIGILITDHNVREALFVIDKAFIIHDGTILYSGTPQEIISHADVRRVYLGEEFSL
jgi:lipopolysaccharide export system ATP-binding protein